MFTGIIEYRGELKEKKRTQNGIVLCISVVGENLSLKKGGSIAINGVCLTIIDFDDRTFSVDVVKDTLTRTNLSLVRKNGTVNIEFPLKVGDRLEGHILEGHVDGTGRILSVIKRGMQTTMKIEVPHKLSHYIIENGSLGIDGISLTVKEMKSNRISVTIIPYTLEHTNLSRRKSGDVLNIEVDRMGKYIEKYLKKNRLCD